MTIPPESIQVGKCYLTSDERVVQVMQFLSNGSLSYRFRRADDTPPFHWTGAVASPEVLPFQPLREVPCDWTPEMDEIGS
jgi:hypothetical protein